MCIPCLGSRTSKGSLRCSNDRDKSRNRGALPLAREPYPCRCCANGADRLPCAPQIVSCTQTRKIKLKVISVHSCASLEVRKKGLHGQGSPLAALHLTLH